MLLQYRFWVSPDGMRDVWRSSRPSRPRPPRTRGSKDRNRTLAAEVRDLKEGRKAIEERARTDLGMIAPTRPSSRSCRPRSPGRRHAGACRCTQGKGRPRPTCREPAVRGAGPSCRRPDAATFRRPRFPSNTHRCSAATCCPGRWPRCSPSPRSTASSSRSRRAIAAGAVLPSLQIRACVPAPAATRREAFGRERPRRAGGDARGTRTGCWCTMPRVPACAATTSSC